MHYNRYNNPYNKRFQQERKDYNNKYGTFSYYSTNSYFYEPCEPEFIGTYIFYTLVPSLKEKHPELEEIIEALSERIFFRTNNKDDKVYTFDKWSSNKSRIVLDSIYSFEDDKKRLFNCTKKVYFYYLKPEYIGFGMPFHITPSEFNDSNKMYYQPSVEELKSNAFNKNGMKLFPSISRKTYNNLSEKAKTYFEEFEEVNKYYKEVKYRLKKSIPKCYLTTKREFLIYNTKKIIDGTQESEYDWFVNHYRNDYGKYCSFTHKELGRTINNWYGEMDKLYKARKKCFEEETKELLTN